MRPETSDSRQQTSDVKRRGQIVLEYFILFAVIALLTLVGLTTFDDTIRQSLDQVFQGAVRNL